MQNEVRKARVRASFRARACTAGLCVGAQVFALGAGAAMALSLNAAWLSALSALPAAAAAAALCRRRLAQEVSGERKNARAQRLLLCLTLLVCCVFAMSALLSLAEQTFLSQARMVFILSITMLFLFLCALGGAAGAARTAFALRFLGPLLPVLLLIRTASSGAWDGLFPLLGAGSETLGLSLVIMLSCAAPALLLLLPPQEAGALAESDVPKAGFFVWRAVLGAAAGAGLLFVMTLGTTYETIAGYSSWGERLRLIPADGGRGGLLFSFLTLCQLTLLLLHAACMLLAAEHALMQAFPALARYKSGLLLLVALAGAALILLTVCGFDGVLAAGAFAGIPAALALVRRGKRK